HFAKHNLALENRRTYKLEAPDIGQLFHEAIKIITEWIQVERNDFKGLTKEDAKQYANQYIEHLAPIMQHQILTSSNRYKYLQRKLSSIIARTTYILSEQARLSGFSPVGMELAFGMKGGLDPLKIELPNGFELHLRGQIDRVDQAREGEQLYLRIIDYKYLQRKLSSIIARTTYILSEQARLSGFSPVGMELAFGMKGGLDPLKIELPNGFELHLRGQIDRVDQAREGEQLYLRIIDYK